MAITEWLGDELEILTVEQFSEWVQKSPRSVYQALRDGRVPGALRVGGSWRISRSAFLASSSKASV